MRVSRVKTHTPRVRSESMPGDHPRAHTECCHEHGNAIVFLEAVTAISKATGKKLEVTRKFAAELDADIAAAPQPFAAFPDLLLRGVADGWAHVRDG